MRGSAPTLGDAAVNAAIAALRAEAALQQRKEIGQDGGVVRSPQTIAGSPPVGGTSQGMQVGSGQIIGSPQTTTNVDYAEQVTVHPPPRDPLAAWQERALLTYLRRTRGECNAVPLGQLTRPTPPTPARWSWRGSTSACTRQRRWS